jgi:hypothetical protein
MLRLLESSRTRKYSRLETDGGYGSKRRVVRSMAWEGDGGKGAVRQGLASEA